MLNTQHKSAATVIVCSVLAVCTGCQPTRSPSRAAVSTPTQVVATGTRRPLQAMPPVARPVQTPLVLDFWPLSEPPQHVAAQAYAAARLDCGKPAATRLDELPTLLCSEETTMAAVEPLVQHLARLPQQRDVILHAIARRLVNLHDAGSLRDWKQQHLALAPELADLVVALQLETGNSQTTTVTSQELESWNPATVESNTGCARTVRTAIISAAAQTSSYLLVNKTAAALRPSCEYARRIYCATKMHGDAMGSFDVRKSCSAFHSKTQLDQALFAVAYRGWPAEPSTFNQWYRTWGEAINAMPHPDAEILALVALENASLVSVRDHECDVFWLARLTANAVVRNRRTSAKLQSRWFALAHTNTPACANDD